MKKSTEKRTVLIVDDVELFIQLEVSHLGRERYDIHTAVSGHKGLEMARSIKPDIILLDHIMPDLSGDKICRMLKDDPETASIPIILTSSGTRENSRSIVEASGCDGLVYKPVRRDLLLSVVENLLKTNTRLFNRVDVSISCSVIIDEKEHSGKIHSLSSTGAFVELEHPVIRGDMMEISFQLPSSDKNINIRAGAVIWRGTLLKQGPSGAGVQFLTIPSDAQDLINDFVEAQLGATTVSDGEK